MLELIAKDPRAFILNQGWASVSLGVARGLMELRSLYEHLQARILELIETLDEVRATYQERDHLRLLVQFRKGSTRAPACGFQRRR